MKLVRGNMLEELQGGGIIVQQVNCQGKMNSGFAKAIRDRWPTIFAEYLDFCHLFESSAERLGHVCIVQVEPGLWVANIFGQEYYGRDPMRYTSYDALDTGFEKLHRWLVDAGVPSSFVHHPLVGCGLGGGHWPVVEAIINHRIGTDTTLWTLD
jgi:O-acetyl-ADP-ribose deacetylase (regulator of RNase III)